MHTDITTYVYSERQYRLDHSFCGPQSKRQVLLGTKQKFPPQNKDMSYEHVRAFQNLPAVLPTLLRSLEIEQDLLDWTRQRLCDAAPTVFDRAFSPSVSSRAEGDFVVRSSSSR